MPELSPALIPTCDTPSTSPCSPDNKSKGEDSCSPLPNPLVGIVPGDINAFNFTLPGGKFRSLLFGRGDWLVHMESPANASAPSLGKIEDQRDLEILPRPFLTLIHPDLHCTLINWLDHHTCMQDGGFEAGLAAGLRKVMSHGNSKLRKLASESLANLHCRDRYHAGDTGVCRITWGELIKLGDCICQHLTIGAPHFCAVEYGDSIHLNEFLQRKLGSADRVERNQCAALAVATGIIARSSSSSTLPARSRVSQSALELRAAEWEIASPLTTSEGAARSFNERTLLRLRRDIVYPGHDRDYRSMCSFLSSVIEEQHVTIRVFGVLYSGSGDTALQVNILGDLETGMQYGFADLLASDGHMRWLHAGNETLPIDKRDWLGKLADFVTAHPWLDGNTIYDEDKGSTDLSPWLTCRQCRRKEKGPVAPRFFYRTSKLTNKWSEAVILESAQAGGYPIPTDSKLDPANASFPILTKEWRGSVPVTSTTTSFLTEAATPYS